MTIFEQLKADLLKARKARDGVRVETLRTMISALDNATAVEVDASFVPIEGHTPDVPRRELSEQDCLGILRVEAEGRQSALAQYEQLGRANEAARLREELAIVAEYLGEG